MTHQTRHRVALFGGSFDPPHLCHVLAAAYTLWRADVDEVWVVPVYRHAFGKTLSPFEIRCAMLEAALAHLGPRIRVHRIEEQLGRQSTEPTYTIDTVEALLAEHPELELTFVCGTDLFLHRHRWRRWEDLKDRLRFFVLGRDGNPDPDGVTVHTHLPALSSTQIRAHVASKQPLNHLVPPSVLALIKTHRLYLEEVRA